MLLQISYQQNVKKSRVALSPLEKETVQNKINEVKSQFRSKLGLIVDPPKDVGRGSSNRENIDRKAFKNPCK